MGTVGAGKVAQVLAAGEYEQLAAPGLFLQDLEGLLEPQAIVRREWLIEKARAGFRGVGHEIENTEAKGEVELVPGALAEQLQIGRAHV